MKLPLRILKKLQQTFPVAADYFLNPDSPHSETIYEDGDIIVKISSLHNAVHGKGVRGYVSCKMGHSHLVTDFAVAESNHTPQEKLDKWNSFVSCVFDTRHELE